MEIGREKPRLQMEVVDVDSLWVTIYGQPVYITFGSRLFVFIMSSAFVVEPYNR